MRPTPHGPVFGVLFLMGAAALAVQTYSAYRRGYAYRSRSERVRRDDEPKRFVFWLCVQVIFVVMLAAMSVPMFMN
jgi:ABC-type Fe3+ transport system permease subunit